MSLIKMIETMSTFDQGLEVEVALKGTSDFKLTNEPTWNWEYYDYRVKITYPIYFETIESHAIAKFISPNKGSIVIQSGKVVNHPITVDLIPHTDPSIWNQTPIKDLMQKLN